MRIVTLLLLMYYEWMAAIYLCHCLRAAALFLFRFVSAMWMIKGMNNAPGIMNS